MSNILDLKPFDLTLALQGDAVVTTTGLPVIELKLLETDHVTYRVIAVIDDGSFGAWSETYTIHGEAEYGEETDRDLYMLGSK